MALSLSTSVFPEEKTASYTKDMIEVCSWILYTHSANKNSIESVCFLEKKAGEADLTSIKKSYELKMPDLDAKTLRILEYKIDANRDFTVKYQLGDTKYLGKGREQYAGDNMWELILTQSTLLSVTVNGKEITP